MRESLKRLSLPWQTEPADEPNAPTVRMPPVVVRIGRPLADPMAPEELMFPMALCVASEPRPLTSEEASVTVPVRPATDWTGDAAAAAAVKPPMSVVVRVTVPVRPATEDTGPYFAAAVAKSERSALVRATAPVRPATDWTGAAADAAAAKPLMSEVVRETAPVRPATD